MPGNVQISPAFLVLANLLPLAGVLLWQWDVGAIIVFYWAENLIIGLFNMIKLVSLGTASAIGMALFFTVHYGAFCAGHGFFLMELFNIDLLRELGMSISGGFETVGHLSASAPNYWLWGLGGLLLSHGVSLALNWFAGGERALTSESQLMKAPYQRIFVLQAVIIFGGLAINVLGSPLPLLLILIVLKIGVDLRAHLKEHNLQWNDLLARPALTLNDK